MDPPVLPAREWFVLARATSLHAQHLRPAIARAGVQAAGGAVALVGRTETELRSLGFPPASARWVSAPDARQVDDDVAWARAEGLRRRSRLSLRRR